MQTKPKKKDAFFECYRAALVLYQSAERYLKEHLGKDNALKLKAWKAEVADLTQKKSRLDGSLQTLKAEVQEAEWSRSAWNRRYSRSRPEQTA